MPAIRSSVKFHLLIELALCSVIVYLFVNKPVDTAANATALSTAALSAGEFLTVNAATLPKQAFLNLAILEDKSIALVDRDGKNVTDNDNRPVIASKDKPLHTIAVLVEDGKGEDDTHLGENLLNMIVKPAQAAHLYKITITSDGQTTCYWYNDYHKC